MLRVAICEDVLSELQKQTQIIQSIMARLSKNVKFFCFRSGEELLMETDTTGNMDIVFLDVEMLGISGIETARILRERDSRVILIFVSCHNQYCKEMIEVQPYAFIDKPVSEEKLEKILKRVFETHLNSDDSYCFSYNKRQYNIPLNQSRFSKVIKESYRSMQYSWICLNWNTYFMENWKKWKGICGKQM